METLRLHAPSSDHVTFEGRRRPVRDGNRKLLKRGCPMRRFEGRRRPDRDGNSYHMQLTDFYAKSLKGGGGPTGMETWETKLYSVNCPRSLKGGGGPTGMETGISNTYVWQYLFV